MSLDHFPVEDGDALIFLVVVVERSPADRGVMIGGTTEDEKGWWRSSSWVLGTGQKERAISRTGLRFIGGDVDGGDCVERMRGGRYWRRSW